MKMSKWIVWAAIAITGSLITAVVVLGLSLRHWVDKGTEVSLKTHTLSEEVHTLRGLLREKEKKAAEDITKEREPLEEVRYMPGEVLVVFKEELTNEEKTTIITNQGFEVIEKVILTDIYRLKLPAGMTVSEAVEKLKVLEEVKHAQPNWIYRMMEMEERR